jgi:predicted AlkP superfamily phosphohydrolase/phosphomutase
MERKALSKKVLVLGIDGMDPRLTRKYLGEGKLPNIKAFLERGVARKDLAMLGILPTITPPSWTTLSTGAYPETHGITDFFRQSEDDLDTLLYNLDSRNCKAEQMWDVLASSGKKTLVWHWPGSSWPPTSDHPNLHVVDGTSPTMINISVAERDWEKIVFASTEVDSVQYRPKAAHTTGAGCLITDLKVEEDESFFSKERKGAGIKNIILTHEENADLAVEKIAFDLVNSPIKDPTGWSKVPDGAREFTIVTSNGLVRRPALILRNDQGVYDSVAVYGSKRESAPYVTVMNDGQLSPVILEDVKVEEQTVPCTRTYKLLDLAPDGSTAKLWMSDALDAASDVVWSPKSLYKDVVENAGYVPNINNAGGTDRVIAEQVKLPTWARYTKWQADALNYLIGKDEYEVIFSHLHNVDMQAHFYLLRCKNSEVYDHNDEQVWQQFMEDVYIDTDRYIGRFLHLLDKGWSIMVLSDHALVVKEEEEVAMLADPTGVMIPVMEELGYTTVKKDGDGKRLKEIDWEHTKAVNARGNFIWINLKGRNKTGIVDPKDKEELEHKIIDDLYSARDKRSGRRLVSLAMRNKDAALLGLSGPDTGDIIFFIDDRFAKTHGDGLSTCLAYGDTSLSPIFMAAGPGFKKGAYVDRVIREVDIVPTVAILAGVRVPAQCEGGPLYQLLDENV